MKQWQSKIRLGYIACLAACGVGLPLALAANQGKNSSNNRQNNTQPAKKVQIKHKSNTPAKPAAPAHIWNLQNADIKSVITEVAKETGKNFLIDPRVNGQVSLISTKPLPPSALYSVFLAMLHTYGYAAIPEKHVIRIVPNINASQAGIPVASKAHPGVGDAVVVRVIPINNVSATQLVPVLRPLLPQWATIAAYPPGNMLIVSGNANSLKHLVDVISRIDFASNNNVDVIRLKNANAEQIANILKSLQSSAQSNGGSTAQVTISDDPRTNAVIISGNESVRLRMRIIVSQLDTSSPTGQGTTQVLFLHYLKAKKIAPILDKVVKGQSKQLAASTGKSSTTSSSSSLANLSAVLPQESDNALIVTAPTSLMKNIKAIINQLDVRPSQVYVQAILVDMSSNALQKLGIQWGTFGYSDNASADSSGGDNTSPNAAFQGGAGVGIIRNGHFQALIAAIRGISGADILSEPSLMVLNNQKASFSIGKELSIQTSQTGALGGNTNNEGVPTVTSQFNQENVGIKLDVTPQINRGNSVQLSINQTNGSLQNPDNPGTTPIINKSDMKTNVLINSGDILVLGGLMSNQKTISTYSTPLLSDLPLIGHLFTYKSTQTEKRDLLIFLRPEIITTPLDGTRVSNEKYKFIRNLQLKWRYDSANNNSPYQRLLPPRGENLDLPVPFS